MGDLIRLSSGNPKMDENLEKINKLGQEKHKDEQEIREAKSEYKKIIFLFAVMGICSVLALLVYVVYGHWVVATGMQKTLFCLGLALVAALIIWNIRNFYKFIFYRLN